MLVWLCACRATQTIRVLGNDLRAAQKLGAKQGRPKTGFSLVRLRWTWVNDVWTLSAAADRNSKDSTHIDKSPAGNDFGLWSSHTARHATRRQRPTALPSRPHTSTVPAAGYPAIGPRVGGKDEMLCSITSCQYPCGPNTSMPNRRSSARPKRYFISGPS